MTLKKEIADFNKALDDFKYKICIAFKIDKILEQLNKLLKK